MTAEQAHPERRKPLGLLINPFQITHLTAKTMSQNNHMKTHAFNPNATEEDRDQAVITLRRNGAVAYRETHTLHTDEELYVILRSCGSDILDRK